MASLDSLVLTSRLGSEGLLLPALGPPPYNHSLLFAPFHPVPEPATHWRNYPVSAERSAWPVGVSWWPGGNMRADSSVSPSSSAVGSEKGIGGGGGRTEARGRLDGDWRLGDPRLDSFEPNPENLRPQPTRSHTSASSGSASMASARATKYETLTLEEHAYSPT